MPWLATKWTVNADATKFTFFLGKSVTFSDGTPLTSAVVKANLNSIAQLGALALGSAYLTGYTGVYVENPYKFTVIFSGSNAQFLQGATTMSLGIVSLATLQNSTASRCQGNFSASGPFTLGGFTANQQVTIVKRPDYKWGAAELRSVRGRPISTRSPTRSFPIRAFASAPSRAGRSTASPMSRPRTRRG